MQDNGSKKKKIILKLNTNKLKINLKDLTKHKVTELNNVRDSELKKNIQESRKKLEKNFDNDHVKRLLNVVDLPKDNKKNDDIFDRFQNINKSFKTSDQTLDANIPLSKKNNLKLFDESKEKFNKNKELKNKPINDNSLQKNTVDLNNKSKKESPSTSDSKKKIKGYATNKANDLFVGNYNLARDKNFQEEEKNSNKKVIANFDNTQKNWKLDLNRGKSDEEYRRISAIMSERKKNVRRHTKFKKNKLKRIIKILVNESLSAENLAKLMGEKSKIVQKIIKDNGIILNNSGLLGIDSIEFIVELCGHTLQKVASHSLEDQFLSRIQSINKGKSANTENFKRRAPVVTIMGHVDHGKTSLLDFFRNSKVIEGEAGGITQHIGAYQVKTAGGFDVTFLDTPGHEAFSKIRVQGANVTDIVILIVAADDGVKPQTIEAIQHAKAAKVPIIVAINKIDKPDINLENVKNQLAQHEIISDEWGGEYMFVPISAKTGQNIEKLEEAIVLQSEIHEFMGDTTGSAAGVVLETKIDPKKGYCATLLVQKGLLQKGDNLVAGKSCCTVREIRNDIGRSVQEAGICQPVEVFGFDSLPESGQYFVIMDSLQEMRDLVKERIDTEKQKTTNVNQPVKNDDFFGFFEQQDVENEKKELSFIIKADTQGSVDAIVYSIEKLESDEMKIKISAANVGLLNSSDIDLAKITGSTIVVFNSRVDNNLLNSAKLMDIEVRQYDIIYQIIDDINILIGNALGPKILENKIGDVLVKKVFGKTKTGLIVGCYVQKGILKKAVIRVIRNDKVLHEGSLRSLRAAKVDTDEVQAGFECGIIIDRFFDAQEGDKIEVIERSEEKRI